MPPLGAGNYPADNFRGIRQGRACAVRLKRSGNAQCFTITAKSLLLAVMVRLAFDYGKCAVKLFGEYQTHHLVRKGHP